MSKNDNLLLHLMHLSMIDLNWMPDWMQTEMIISTTCYLKVRAFLLEKLRQMQKFYSTAVK